MSRSFREREASGRLGGARVSKFFWSFVQNWPPVVRTRDPAGTRHRRPGWSMIEGGAIAGRGDASPTGSPSSRLEVPLPCVSVCKSAKPCRATWRAWSRSASTARQEAAVGAQLCTDDADRLRDQLGALLAVPGGRVLLALLDDEPAGLLLARRGRTRSVHRRREPRHRGRLRRCRPPGAAASGTRCSSARRPWRRRPAPPSCTRRPCPARAACSASSPGSGSPRPRRTAWSPRPSCSAGSRTSTAPAAPSGARHRAGSRTSSPGAGRCARRASRPTNRAPAAGRRAPISRARRSTCR